MKYLFYNEHGRIVSVKEMPEGDIVYYSGSWISTDLVLVNESTHYIDNIGNPVAKPTQPNPYAVFDYTIKAWVSAVTEDVKLEVISKLKQRAGDLIFTAYSQIKQNNMQAKYLELLTDGLSTSEQALNLRSAWTWIKEIRDASNIAELLINSATTVEAIEGILENAYSSIGAAPTI
jgi:23S rRNA maturation mini-RNase III